MNMLVRRAEDRGHADHGWLNSHHTFSFADYFDPAHMGFGPLRVINDDRVAGGEGFPSHPHRDMEIVSYVLEGALEHRDTLGANAVIRPGDVQRMTAGTGVRHSEYNASESDPVHFLQIWILPEAQGLKPGYEQKTFSEAEKRDRLRLVASRDGRDGSITVHRDVDVYATLLSPGANVAHDLRKSRGAWVHVARGAVTLNGEKLKAGDGAALTGAGRLDTLGEDQAEVLIFDMAM
jgi:redox-sensitive bicupin YhaK (pirin superfamily)